ncbi:MAG: hypothetical protein O9284_14170 [Steroidobacteraceae bacterium]|jgi:hypothetical protein|nr:hypothetical protein [Steroidobacteraceae bacterium]
MRPATELPDEGEAGGAHAPPLGASGWSRARQDVAIVLWPSFLAAAVATMFFFAAFDPVEIGRGGPLEALLASRNAGYAFGFFVFWAITAVSSSLTLYLARTQRPERGPRIEPWMRDIP